MCAECTKRENQSQMFFSQNLPRFEDTELKGKSKNKIIKNPSFS